MKGKIMGNKDPGSTLKKIRENVIENDSYSVEVKIIYCMIVAFSMSRGYCWLSNSTISRTLDMSIGKVSEILGLLEDENLIVISKKGQSRKLWIFEEYQEEREEITKKLHQNKSVN